MMHSTGWFPEIISEFANFWANGDGLALASA